MWLKGSSFEGKGPTKKRRCAVKLFSRRAEMAELGRGKKKTIASIWEGDPFGASEGKKVLRGNHIQSFTRGNSFSASVGQDGAGCGKKRCWGERGRRGRRPARGGRFC